MLEQRLLELENELRARKAASPLNYGALQRGDTPTVRWDGQVRNPTPDKLHAARFVVTFTRTDGINLAPYVNFAYDYTLGRYYYDDQIAAGYLSSVSGRDLHAMDEHEFADGIYSTGNNYVQWRIDFGATGQWFYSGSDGTDIHLTVQAISTVPGTLRIERVI